MFDQPPDVSPDDNQAVVLNEATNDAQPHLPTKTLADGTVVIDLSSLGPPPEDCLEREPDPFNPEIVVCRKVALSPRLGANYGPSADELTEGSAVPRARVRLSEDAEAEANVTSNAVGGWNANGGEVKAKIKF